MNTLIVATDFSKAAQSAANYALELAFVLNAKLLILHSYTIPLLTSEPTASFIGMDELVNIAHENTQNEVERLQALNKNKIIIDSEVVVGDLMDSIDVFIQDLDPLLVVLGTTGVSDNFLWGSMSVKALRSLNCPVLLVPADYVYKPIHRACYAADSDQIKGQAPMQQLRFWKFALGFDLTLVHIHLSGRKESPLKDLSQTIVPALNCNYEEVEHTDLQLAIRSYLSSGLMDMIIISPRKHGFWDEVFRPSRTKQIAKTSKIPILAIRLL